MCAMCERAGLSSLKSSDIKIYIEKKNDKILKSNNLCKI